MSRKPNNIPFHFDNLLHYGQTITHGICLSTNVSHLTKSTCTYVITGYNSCTGRDVYDLSAQ